MMKTVSSRHGALTALPWRNFSYIVAIISRAVIIVLTRSSVPLMRREGQRPRKCSVSVASAEGMTRPASGRTMRFVSRKCWGNEWK